MKVIVIMEWTSLSEKDDNGKEYEYTMHSETTFPNFPFILKINDVIRMKDFVGLQNSTICTESNADYSEDVFSTDNDDLFIKEIVYGYDKLLEEPIIYAYGCDWNLE